MESKVEPWIVELLNGAGWHYSKNWLYGWCFAPAVQPDFRYVDRLKLLCDNNGVVWFSLVINRGHVFVGEGRKTQRAAFRNLLTQSWCRDRNRVSALLGISVKQVLSDRPRKPLRETKLRRRCRVRLRKILRSM